MSNRSKGRTRTGAGLSDAARPDERMGDDLEELDSPRKAAGSEDDEAPLLAEGEPVGAWSEEDEAPNAFDAAGGAADDDNEEEEEVESGEDAPVGYQASSAPFDRGSSPPPPPTPKRRRSH